MSGAGESSRSPKKKSTVVVANTDGVTKATTSNASASRSGGGKKQMQIVDIEEEPRFTGREMRLTAAVAILTILLFGLGSFIVVSGPLSALLNPRCLDERLGFSGLCDSEDCIDISYRSVHSANFSSDPCDDFYQFACAKWQGSHPISEEQLILAANINQLKDSVDSFLKTLLEEETPSHKLDPGVTALKNFYKSCINYTNPNEDELILDLLDTLGGYKTTDLWSDNAFDLTDVILKFLQVNAAPLFDLTLDIDAKNRERYALIVELPRATSLVPNIFRPPSHDDDLMHSELAFYNLIEGNEPIAPVEVPPGLFNKSQPNSKTSGAEAGVDASTNSSSGANTVDRQALYKIIKDSMDAKRREDLKSLVRKVGHLLRLNEAEVISDSADVAVIASNIEKIKPSQRSRKFWKQQNKEFNAFTLDQLQQQFGAVQWSFLFGELMGFDDVASREAQDDYNTGAGASGNSGRGNQKGAGTTINWHNSTIYVPYPDYLRRVLQMTQYTSKRMLYNTMLILYVKDMLHDLIPRSSSTPPMKKEEAPSKQQHHSRLRNQHRNHHHHQSQQRQQKTTPPHQQPRWKTCVSATKSVFSMELSSLYMKSFKPSTLQRIREDVEEIFANVKKTLIQFLNRSTELSSKEKRPTAPEHHNNFYNSNQTNNNQERSGRTGGSGWNATVPTSTGTGEISNNPSNENGSNSDPANYSKRKSEGYKPPISNSTNGRGSFKEEAIRKIATLKGNFLGPSFYLQEDFLDDAIKNIRIDPNDFLFNVKVVYRTFREQLYHLYWKPVDEERATWAFVTFPTTVNAFYIPQFNSIVVPLAFLNPPNYVERAPVYINYATIAHTLAHEALHALDRSGSGFDASGRLHDLWEAEPKGFLQEKANCVAKKYSENFRKILPFYQTHVPIQVDGNLTQNENLADIAGLQVAFSAYRKYRLNASKEELKMERRIPGLMLTLEQSYFLTFAQAYCANISPMGYIFFLEIEEHTPHPERINGMLMNTQEFAEAYSCRAGSRMNPPLKCTVW